MNQSNNTGHFGNGNDDKQTWIVLAICVVVMGLLAMVGLSGCNNDPWIVRAKHYTGNPICKYEYRPTMDWSDNNIVTEDSCNKYNVGDTMHR